MTFQSRMAAVATRLIGSYGFSGVLRRVTSGAIDPVTGGSTEKSTDYPVKAVAQALKAEQIDGTVIQSGDRLYTLTDSVEPLNGDLFKVGSEYWPIISIQPMQVQDGNVAYRIQVRK